MDLFSLLIPTNSNNIHNSNDSSIYSNKSYDLDKDSLKAQNPPQDKVDEELQLNLSIDDYDYFELLQLFKINHISSKDQLVQLYETIQSIEKQCYSSNTINKKQKTLIIIFYKKAFKIIEVINLIFDCNLDKYKDFYKIKTHFDNIKKIQNFYKLDSQFIIKQLVNIQNIDNQTSNDLTSNEQTSNNQPSNDIKSYKIPTEVFPSEINKGELNYLQRRIQKTTINLNTAFRDKYFISDPCDFLYILPQTIKNVVSLKLASIEIPNTWFLFNHKNQNNFFFIEFHTSNEIKHFKIIIPNGNYNHKSLEEYLNNYYFYLNCDHDPINDHYWLQYIKFNIHPITFHSSFELLWDNIHDDLKNDPEFFVNFKFFDNDSNKQIINNTFGWILGFRLANYSLNTDKIISEALFDAGGDRYIFFSLNDFQYNSNGNNIVILQDNILDDHILAKIPMINGKLSLIIDDNYNLINKKRIFNGPVDLNRFFIKVFDPFGNIIDLNKMDFSFSIELEILYEKF